MGLAAFSRLLLPARSKMKSKLVVMKFGGTSVGDASCIARAAQIAASTSGASRESSVLVVVSAMSGVTDRLIEAATLAESGDSAKSQELLEAIRRQHEAALRELALNADARKQLSSHIGRIFGEAKRLCEGTALLRELTPRSLDVISSLGERLSAPIFSAMIVALGTPSEPVEATELIVTDGFYGGAEPLMDPTRQRCEARLRPLLQKGAVPVVTGFIGASQEGALTTLGRGGSDYSATILSAALHADEAIIWTDVNGVLSADPRLVPEARTIPEISYREAAELAYFGAKVLHPKTLRAVMPLEIPVWIRNSFAPEEAGTKITAKGRSGAGGVKAITAIGDVSLIALGGPGIVGLPDVVGRTFSTTARVRANVLLISQSSSQNDICFIVASADAKRTVDALRDQFAQDLAHHKVEHISLDPRIAIVAVVGENMRGTVGMAGRTFSALGREGVNIIAIAQGSSESNISFVVEQKNMKKAVVALHWEFGLGAAETNHAERGQPA
jgi:aspartokinase/homoserine dehydrogenase 1